MKKAVIILFIALFILAEVCVADIVIARRRPGARPPGLGHIDGPARERHESLRRRRAVDSTYVVDYDDVVVEEEEEGQAVPHYKLPPSYGSAREEPVEEKRSTTEYQKPPKTSGEEKEGTGYIEWVDEDGTVHEEKI